MYEDTLHFIFFNVFCLFTDGLIDRAKRISDEMTMVLSLDENTSGDLSYSTKRFIDAQKIRSTFKMINQ